MGPFPIIVSGSVELLSLGFRKVLFLFVFQVPRGPPTHTVALVVNSSLKMGKGKIAAQVSKSRKHFHFKFCKELLQ